MSTKDEIKSYLDTPVDSHLDDGGFHMVHEISKSQGGASAWKCGLQCMCRLAGLVVHDKEEVCCSPGEKIDVQLRLENNSSVSLVWPKGCKLWFLGGKVGPRGGIGAV